MGDEAQHKESENHARIRTERFLMQTFGVTRSDAHKALRQDAENRRVAALSVPLPGPAIGGQQQVQISETVHEIKKGGSNVPTGADAGGANPPATTGTVLTILLVSGVFQYWNLVGSYDSDV